jgi:hypothetical protein
MVASDSREPANDDPDGQQIERLVAHRARRIAFAVLVELSARSHKSTETPRAKALPA